MSRSSRRAALAVALGVVAAALACTADQPTAAPRASLSLPGLLTTCDPLPDARVVDTVGPAGGELRIGPHRLTIPPGALDSATVITGEAPTSSTVLVQLSPTGLRFATPSTLTLSYAHCRSPLGLPPIVVQVDDLLRILDVLPSQRVPGSAVTARLAHFSNYAIAW